MNFLEILLVSIIALLSLGLVFLFLFYFGRALKPVVGRGGKLNPESLRENWNFKKKVNLISEIDNLISKKDIDAACKRLREVFILEHVQGNVATLESIRAHNYLGLTKVIALAQEAKIAVPSISSLEALFDERFRLLSLHQDSSLLHKKIQEKRRREGKGDSWDGGEFESRISELSEDIETNARELREELDDLFILLTRRGASDVNLH